jgi:hypothetical protein
MPQYVIPQDAASKAYDVQADAAFKKGADAGATADNYIRATGLSGDRCCASSGSAATSAFASRAWA